MTGARGVIINVTGGPDMSLIEVNEASCVIQEAAHEDANIIFGAVVDPALEGKVKITVIATGFDRARPALSTTPVDMRSYTDHLNAIAATAVEQAVERVPAPGPSAATSLLGHRRSPLDLKLPLAAAGGAQGESLELDSPFDVPAFLRRQS